MLTNLFAFIASALLTLIITPYIRKAALKIGAIDDPSEDARKKHRKIMPRGGGIAIVISFILLATLLLPAQPSRTFWGVVLASLLVFLVGLWDDIRRLSPWAKLIVQVIAALIAILGFGLSTDVINNPLGQQIDLTVWKIDVFSTTLSVWSVVFSLLWLVGMTNTINFLDGLDGLATGISAIAAFVLYFISISPNINQPDTAILALILLGACIGFLRYNFNPAKIFLGDSGAYFLGFMLASLALISGAKLATALLVLGVPIFDAVWSVIRRLAKGKSPFRADRGHFHYMLLDAGFSQRAAVLIMYALAMIFGIVALIGSGKDKAYGLFILVGFIITAFIWLSLRISRRRAMHQK